MIAIETTTETTSRTSESVVNSTGSYPCVNGSVMAEDEGLENHQWDAFLYIIIVLSFYALSMVLLMIKYIRREEEEMFLDFYYAEFVKRDHFQKPHVKNRMLMERDRRHIAQVMKSADIRDSDSSDHDGETEV